jgi:hypothetical protein
LQNAEIPLKLQKARCDGLRLVALSAIRPRHARAVARYESEASHLGLRIPAWLASTALARLCGVDLDRRDVVDCVLVRHGRRRCGPG